MARYHRDRMHVDTRHCERQVSNKHVILWVYCLFALDCYVIYFCKSPWSSLDRLPSTDQNWWSKRRLIWPKPRCSRPNYSHFRENWKKIETVFCCCSSKRFLADFFYPRSSVACPPEYIRRSGHLGPLGPKKNIRPVFSCSFPHTSPLFCTLSC